jgi:hypothetical protein
MTIPLVWTAAAVLYVLFRLWYDNWRGPMNAKEVDQFEAWIKSRESLDDDVRRAMLEFLHSDDGKEFIMVNMIKLPGDKVTHPDTGEKVKPHILLREYTRPFMGAVFKAAGHPVIVTRAVGGYADAVNVPDDPGWTATGLVRYRSRRDMFKIASSPMFDASHGYKIAAMASTFAYPAQRQVSLVAGPRVWVFLLLSLAASLATIAAMSGS